MAFVGGVCLRIFHPGLRLSSCPPVRRGRRIGRAVGRDGRASRAFELLRLVAGSLPIAAVDPVAPLLEETRGAARRARRPANAQRRDRRVGSKADAFVPAGGRPATIHGGNWQDYLDDDGPPSTRVVVEEQALPHPGSARVADDAGVTVVKDSSANKCGVICSLGTPCGSSKGRFMEIKEAFVEQFLERRRAGGRGGDVFAEHRAAPATKVQLSVELSQIINRLTDAINGCYEDWVEGDREKRELVTEHVHA